jgi:hypothetical protein
MTDITRWEYYVETVGSAWKSTTDEDLLKVLNELGADGWEVFHSEQLQNSSKVRLIARRRIAAHPQKHKGWP